MSELPSDRLIWFGVLGGPLAWASQFVANLGVTLFRCDEPGRWELPLHLLQVLIGAAGAAVALASSFVAVQLYRATARDRELSLRVRRGFGGEPPVGRIHFLAIVGLVVNFLALAIIVMTLVGGPALVVCQQS